MGIFSGLLDALFPRMCLACSRLVQARVAFCPDCAAKVERLPVSHCERCADPGDFPTGCCPRCSGRPPPFSKAFAPFLHAGALSRAIHRFKYEDHPEFAQPLAELLAVESAAFLKHAPHALVAVPLHRNRFLSRKYDQAELLTRALCKHTGWQHLFGALDRVKETYRQVGLTELQREQNLHRAFEAQPWVKGTAVLLIDDVFTTGSTARSAALALRRAGARDVQVLCLARAYSL